MNKKITFLVLIAAAWVVFLPGQSFAYSSDIKTTTVSEQIPGSLAMEQRRGRGRNRGWNNRRWNRSINRRLNRNNRRSRVVRQVYYRNGRRYVRTIRVYR